METTGSKFDIRDYIRVVIRRWWFILIVALAATLVGGAISAAIPKSYRAVATVVIPAEQRSFLLLSGAPTEGEEIALPTQAIIAASNETARRTQKSLAERAINPIFVDAAEIAGAISADAYSPNVIRINAVTENEFWAREFANQTAYSFLAVMEEIRQRRATNAQQYLEEQAAIVRDELEELIAQKRVFQREWGLSVSGVSTEHAEARPEIVIAEPEMKGVLRATETDLSAAQARLAQLRARRDLAARESVVTHTITNPVYMGMLEQLHQSRIALVDLQARYQSDYPAVRLMEARIRELEAQIDREAPTVEVSGAVDPARVGDLQARVDAASQEVAELTSRIGTMRQIVAVADEQKAQALEKQTSLEDLQAQISLKRAAFRQLLTQLEEKKLTVASEAGRAMVDAALRATATTPSLTRAILFSFALGLFLGFVLAIMLEALDDTIRRPDDLAGDPDLRFLGIIPWTGETGARQLILLEAPKSPPAEAFRTLRSNVNFATVDQPLRTMLVTSAGAGEGKSLTAANLAVAFAQAGERVLILDTDLRRPAQHRFFGVEAGVGLTNVLVGEMSLDEAVVRTEVDNLELLPSGPLPPNPAELLDSTRMVSLLEEAAQRADIVILDSPPAIMLTDALLLASRVDQTVLVAASGQVTREAFGEMVRLIRQARGSVLGVVLNKLRLTASDYYYYYYYYYYDYSRPRPGESVAEVPPAQSERQRRRVRRVADGRRELLPPETPEDDELPF